jgi:hypothetical protein
MGPQFVILASIDTSSIVVQYYHILFVACSQLPFDPVHRLPAYSVKPVRPPSNSASALISFHHVSFPRDTGSRFRRVARRDLVAALVGRLLRRRDGVFLEELHASQSETGRSSSVQGRRGTTLQGVTKLRRSGVEQVFAFFLKNIGQDFGCVHLG